jgi:twitching motility two-component system response regulator PilH
MVAPRGGSDRLVCAGRAAGYNRGGDNTGTSMARILIVDDSPSQLMGIRRIVEKLGHDASTAEDGAAGVDAAKREVPDLILMDVVMPNLNGFQATRAITRDPATRHIPVILVTTKDQDTDRVWGMRQGAKAYITKPFGEAELADVIEQWLAGGPQDTNGDSAKPPAPASDAGSA